MCVCIKIYIEPCLCVVYVLASCATRLIGVPIKAANVELTRLVDIPEKSAPP